MKQDYSVFKECVELYFEENKFLYPWFRRHGKTYMFIFKKNLKVTNIQYAEFISLVRSNIKIHNQKNVCSIQFLSVSDFKETLIKLLDTFKPSYKKGEDNSELIDTICECYFSVLSHIIVVDIFFGSCSIFLPYNMELDIQKICFLSGYIHSCGENIYTRRISKASEEEFFGSLRSHIELKYDSKKNRIPFSLYAHEDFTPFDREEGKDFFVNGLDDIKFYAEKLYMQNTPLTLVIENMRSNKFFNSKLDIAKAGDYHRNIKGNNESSLWLIVDRLVNDNYYYPSKDLYFICYQQKYINENPLHLFDENKPGWIDHTTIPHTLMGAMLNISIPLARKNKRSKSHKIKVLDPFVGSGTTYLELLKYPEIDFCGSDLNNLALVVAKDNIAFFGLNIIELTKIQIELLNYELLSTKYSLSEKEVKFVKKEVKSVEVKINDFISELSKSKYEDKSLSLKSRIKDIKTNSEKIYNYVGNYFIKCVTKDNIADISESIFTRNLKTLNKRLLYYIFLKALKRNFNAFQRGSKDFHSAFTKEIRDLSLQINNLIKLRKRAPFIDSNNLYSKYYSNYSYGCSINPRIFTNLKKENKINIEPFRDAIDKLKEAYRKNKYFDIIITDPPYGFNTEEVPTKFAKLYNQMIDLMIKCLNPNGQLLFCLPEISNTGRQIHFFTQKEIVIHQVLISVLENKKTLIVPYNILPKPRGVFYSPYYWESEKALRRSILHFVLS
jgi:hypothetical protein